VYLFFLYLFRLRGANCCCRCRGGVPVCAPICAPVQVFIYTVCTVYTRRRRGGEGAGEGAVVLWRRRCGISQASEKSTVLYCTVSIVLYVMYVLHVGVVLYCIDALLYCTLHTQNARWFQVGICTVIYSTGIYRHMYCSHSPAHIPHAEQNRQSPQLQSSADAIPPLTLTNGKNRNKKIF